MIHTETLVTQEHWSQRLWWEAVSAEEEIPEDLAIQEKGKAI